MGVTNVSLASRSNEIQLADDADRVGRASIVTRRRSSDMLRAFLFLIATPALCAFTISTSPAVRIPTRRGGSQICMRAEPSPSELQKYGLTMEDMKRYGNRTPAEVANMKKWGNILKEKDTFDGDYLEKKRKNRGQPTAAADEPSQDGEKIIVAGSVVVLLAVAAVALQG